jgi:hypothetical protein
MQQHDGPNDHRALGRRWRRWTDIVELFAQRRLARRWVDEGAYAGLHRELAAACGALAAAGGERGAYYETLGELVRPWLSCRVLGQVDQEILLGVLFRCRQVDRELNGRGRWSLGRWARRGAVALAWALPAAGLAWGAGRVGPALAGVLGEGWRTLTLAVGESTEGQRLLVGGIVVLLIATALFRVSGR